MSTQPKTAARSTGPAVSRREFLKTSGGMVLAASPLGPLLQKATAQTGGVRLQLTRNLSVAVHPIEGRQWQTPVATHNGDIYLAYVDPQLRTVVTRVSQGGGQQTGVVLANTVNDSHNLPSLGIDANGFIHVAYNMHGARNDPWQYSVSRNPEDPRSFTSIGPTNPRVIPGRGVTYPQFFRDREGVLYAAARNTVGRARDPGWRGFMVARYNAGSQRWTMLGGTNYRYGERVLFWNNSGRTGFAGTNIFYQEYQGKVFFDANNRMHLSVDTFINPGDRASHILYAFSDNQGDTWFRAEGQRITSLPITAQTASVVEAASRGIFEGPTFPGADSNGRPVVNYRQSQSGPIFIERFEGGRWVRLPVQNQNIAHGPFLTDLSGTFFDFTSRGIQRSATGSNYQLFSATVGDVPNLTYDNHHLVQSNQIRYRAIVGNQAQVFTARFS
jgi:hypothetical protein